MWLLFSLNMVLAGFILEEVEDLCFAQAGSEGTSSLVWVTGSHTLTHTESHSGSLFRLDQTAETGSHDAGEGQGGEDEGEGSSPE